MFGHKEKLVKISEKNPDHLRLLMHLYLRHFYVYNKNVGKPGYVSSLYRGQKLGSVDCNLGVEDDGIVDDSNFLGPPVWRTSSWTHTRPTVTTTWSGRAERILGGNYQGVVSLSTPSSGRNF